MKTIYKLILLALTVTFFSCQKNENGLNSNSSITSNGILAGTILKYTPSLCDSVKAIQGMLIGKGPVSIDGKFSIVLSTPTLTEIGNLSGIVTSDSTAMVGSIITIYTFKGGNFNGQLTKSSLVKDSLTAEGFSYAVFMYSDRDFTLKGTHKESNQDLSRNYSIINSEMNIIVKKGWNELISSIKLSAKTSTSETMTFSLTNSISSDLQWQQVSSGPTFMRGNVPSLIKMKSEKLFWKL